MANLWAMPFKSEAQRRYMWSQHPQVARQWADEEKTMAKKKNYETDSRRARNAGLVAAATGGGVAGAVKVRRLEDSLTVTERPTGKRVSHVATGEGKQMRTKKLVPALVGRAQTGTKMGRRVLTHEALRLGSKGGKGLAIAGGATAATGAVLHHRAKKNVKKSAPLSEIAKAFFPVKGGFMPAKSASAAKATGERIAEARRKVAVRSTRAQAGEKMSSPSAKKAYRRSREFDALMTGGLRGY